jgi:hypothetical protein
MPPMALWKAGPLLHIQIELGNTGRINPRDAPHRDGSLPMLSGRHDAHKISVAGESPLTSLCSAFARQRLSSQTFFLLLTAISRPRRTQAADSLAVNRPLTNAA